MRIELNVAIASRGWRPVIIRVPLSQNSAAMRRLLTGQSAFKFVPALHELMHLDMVCKRSARPYNKLYRYSLWLLGQ